MATIVQINYVNDISEEEVAARTNLDSARKIADQAGLQWKVWIRNPETRESGGIYLFDSREEAEAYVNGPIITALRASAAPVEVSVKYFDVREEPSAITRAPLSVAVAGS